MRESTLATVHSAREKLRLLGVAPGQITQIERAGKTTDHLTIYSPTSGIVIHKDAQEGMYVDTGTRIYTIADLSEVWVMLDAYESDLSWLRLGQKVEFTTVSYPGEPFTGTIAFIDPMLTPRTRTVKVRLNAPNPDGRLKPGMFVKAVARAKVGPGEGDSAPDLSSVDISKLIEPLVIPASAVLKTGTRAIVYLRVDPSPLQPTDSVDWLKLMSRIRRHLAPVVPVTHGFLNSRCPIMGGELDPTKVTPELIRPYKGGKVAFCCAGCPAAWDKLSDAEKQAKLGPVSGDEHPVKSFWALLTPGLRQGLLATPTGAEPSAELRGRFVREVNDLLTGRSLWGWAVRQRVQIPEEAKDIAAAGVENLPPMKLTRLNRLLLEALFPEAITKAKAGPIFEGREILLGPRAGDYYVVRRGLKAGDRVVTRGNFKIDSALQILAKPSMMSPDNAVGVGGHAQHGGAAAKKKKKETKNGPAMELPAMFRHQAGQVLMAGEKAKKAAAGPLTPAVRQAFADLERAIQKVDVGGLKGHAAMLWREYSLRLINDAAEGSQARTPRDMARALASLRGNLAAVQTKLQLSHPHAAPSRSVMAPKFQEQLGGVYACYLAMQTALASDQIQQARQAAQSGLAALGKVDMTLVTGADHNAWMKFAAEAGKALAAIARAENLEDARRCFDQYSGQMIAMAKRFGVPSGMSLFELTCTMAFDNRGARWLQSDRKVRNPYFGAAMLQCGNVTDVINLPPARANGDSPHGR